MKMVVAMMGTCVRCHRDTVTMIDRPLTVCRDCLYDRQPRWTKVSTRTPPPRWKTWPTAGLLLVGYIWLIDLAVDWPLWVCVLAYVMNGVLLIRASGRMRRRVVAHNAELKSIRDEGIRKRIGGWDATI